MEPNETNRTLKFDEEFRKIPVIKKHPHTVPFVGCNWGKTEKMLLVLESPGIYADERRSRSTWKNWYEIPNTELTESQKDTTNIAEHIDTDPQIATYKQIIAAINESGFSPNKGNQRDVLKYIAITNFFQRPSLMVGNDRTEKDFDEADENIGNTTLESILTILKPKYMFFLSSGAWNAYNKRLFPETNTGHGCHPSVSWWNRKNNAGYTGSTGKGISGKDAFICFIKKNKIFV